MRPEYDLVVLGGGTAGLFAAKTAAGLGARVALIEERRTGGECLYTGCVPSKAILASAALAQGMRHADALGIEPVEPRPDFARVMERIGTVIEAAGVEDSPEYLESAGVEVVASRGRFTGPGRIEAGGRELRWRAAVIATGSRPAIPPIPGLEEAQPLTSDNVFELRERPGRLAVLGGGAIGVELGQAFARLGSDVSIAEALTRLLPGEEAEVGELLAGLLREEGIEVRTGARCERITPSGDGGGTLILVSSGAGDGARDGRGADGGLAGRREIPFDRVLLATGRQPASDDLGLEAVGVELGDRGAIRVDRFLRTTGSHVYAAGDVVDQLQLTHVAAYHGLVAVANALFRARRKVERDWIPWVTFTDPEIARVGLTEAEARERLGRDPLIFRHEHAALDRALTEGRPEGFAKLVANRRGRLLGATIVGPAAGESIAEPARLIREGRKVGDLSQMIHAYPTFTESPARAADDWWRRKYFTPGARRWFRPLLRILRSIDRPRG